MQTKSTQEDQIKLTNIQHTVGTQLIVLFDFFKETDKYLHLKKGDLITLVKETKISEENCWWKGLCNGKIGYFPSNFVALKSNNPKLEEIIITNSRYSEKIMPNNNQTLKKTRSSSFSKGDNIIKNENKNPPDLKLNLSLLKNSDLNGNNTEKPKTSKQKKTAKKKKVKLGKQKFLFFIKKRFIIFEKR